MFSMRMNYIFNPLFLQSPLRNYLFNNVSSPILYYSKWGGFYFDEIDRRCLAAERQDAAPGAMVHFCHVNVKVILFG